MSLVLDAAMVIATFSLVVAVVSALVALDSARTARESLSLSRQQDIRRGPRIAPYLVDGYMRRDADRRLYAVSLSVTNPTDADNSVVLLELEVRYRLPAGSVMTMRLAHDPALSHGFGGPGMQALAPPVPIAAHGAFAGWGYFVLPTGAIGDAEIDDYKIRLVDAHGIASTVDFGPVREISSATKQVS